jgi:alpha-mannosidase
LQQFHDILPGSSIAWVYENAEENYRLVAETLEGLIGDATTALAGGSTDGTVVRFNASPVSAGDATALGGSLGSEPEAVPPVRSGDHFVFDTGAVVATIDAAGHVVSFVEHATGRDAIAPGTVAAEYTVFRDTPNQWEAWDIDRAYQRNGNALSATSVSVEGDSLVVVRPVGSSTVTTRYSAVAGQPELTIETEVDWHEQQKLLKLAFPLDVRASVASSEIQFGHIDRPTHQNTSWDFARFETSAHRWVHVAEPGFGVAVANDSTYGHDITRSTRADGGTTTLVRESLLRGPTFPDPHADQGHHVFRTVLRVGESVLDAADSGYRLNLPVRTVAGSAPVSPLVVVSSPQVFVEAVKLAEDRSGDVIVRLYEGLGGRATDVGVDFGFDVASVAQVDLLERPLGESWDAGSPVSLTLRPFEIVTLRVQRAQGPRRRTGTGALVRRRVARSGSSAWVGAFRA